MKLLSLFAFLTFVAAGVAVAEDNPASPFELPMSPTPMSEIDRLVAARLQQLRIEPARVCSDAVFARRVYLDVIGTLPTAEEAEAFIKSDKMNKRRDLIETLLARDEFADYWAMKWSDVLRLKAEFPINLWPNAVQAYHHWIRASIAENKPYDRFVRELLTASGSNFRVPPANFYRAMQDKTPEGAARAVALTFMGARAEKWPAERIQGAAAFFSQIGFKSTAEWKEEIVFFDPSKPVAGSAFFPDGNPVKLGTERDPREVFADWLITPGNPWFSASISNRVWGWLLGRGIVHEIDDLRSDNPGSNPELLRYLQTELVGARYDLKHLFRIILNSRTYQLSAIARSTQAEGEMNFAFYAPRRLEAEVLIDALNQLTGTTEKYASPIPEPFTFIPEDQRAIALADGSITSSFLELFGRSPRATGLLSERNSRVTAPQILHLLNSSHVHRKIEQGPKFQALLRSKDSPEKNTATLYLTILSRYPTDAERKTVTSYIAPKPEGTGGNPADVAWALINSAEFLHRH